MSAWLLSLIAAVPIGIAHGAYWDLMEGERHGQPSYVILYMFLSTIWPIVLVILGLRACFQVPYSMGARIAERRIAAAARRELDEERTRQLVAMADEELGL